jgi:lipoyl(octanoyl) transferase
MIKVRQRGHSDYLPVLEEMRRYTDTRGPHSNDEIWLLEHPSVYTLGLGASMAHVLQETSIPIVRTDRGGQVTYHGPGQLVVYLLLDLTRSGLKVRELVRHTEQAIIDLLRRDYGLEAQRRTGAPGVYIADSKVAALGFRIRRGCCYHGLALNVDMDLSPYQYINPCGFRGLQVTDLKTLGVRDDVRTIGERLLPHLLTQFESSFRRGPAPACSKPGPESSEKRFLLDAVLRRHDSPKAFADVP